MDNRGLASEGCRSEKQAAVLDNSLRAQYDKLFADNTRLSAENAELLAKNRAVTEDCLRLIKLFREASEQTNLIVYNKLSELDGRIGSIDSKLSRIAAVLGTDIEEKSALLGKTVDELNRKTACGVGNAADKAQSAVDEAEKYSDEFTKSVNKRKQELLDEIGELSSRINELRSSLPEASAEASTIDD